MKTFAGTQTMVFGDWHGNLGFAATALAAAHELNIDGPYLHVGDFGFWGIGHEESSDPNYLPGLEVLLAAQGRTLLFVDGNHEEHSRLNALPKDADGLRRISEHMYHIPRGEVLQIGDKKVLGLGGAYSIDRKFRIKDYSWFEDEVISEADVQRALSQGPVDLMISHEAPMLKSTRTTGSFEIDQITSKQRDYVARVFVESEAKLLVHGHHHHAYSDGYAGESVIGLGCDSGADLITARGVENNRVLVNLEEL